MKRMTNTVELEVAIKRSGLTKQTIAQELGLSTMGLHQKINNVTEFKASEIYLLSELLSIKNKEEIFFASEVISNQHNEATPENQEVS